MGNIIQKKNCEGKLLYYAGMKKENGIPKPQFEVQPFMAKTVSDHQLMRLVAYFSRKKEIIVITGGTHGTENSK